MEYNLKEKLKCTHKKNTKHTRTHTHTDTYTSNKQISTPIRTAALPRPTQPSDELREMLVKSMTKARAFLSKLDTRFQLVLLPS